MLEEENLPWKSSIAGYLIQISQPVTHIDANNKMDSISYFYIFGHTYTPICMYLTVITNKNEWIIYLRVGGEDERNEGRKLIKGWMEKREGGKGFACTLIKYI